MRSAASERARAGEGGGGARTLCSQCRGLGLPVYVLQSEHYYLSVEIFMRPSDSCTLLALDSVALDQEDYFAFFTCT